MDLFLKETAGVVEKEKKSRIFTRDRTSSSNKYKKSPMPAKQSNDNDHSRSNASGTGNLFLAENVSSMAEVFRGVVLILITLRQFLLHFFFFYYARPTFNLL